jgi:hypothetical protein
MKITWVPSKKASAQGIVPADYSQYDIDTEVDTIPEASLVVMLRKPYRHAMNNESAASYLAEVTKAKEETPPREVDRAKFLHDWRSAYRQKVLDGKLGMREAAIVPVYDEVTTEARAIVYAAVRTFIEKKSAGTILLGDMTPRSLAKDYEGKTVDGWITDLLDHSTPRAKKYWADAEANVQKRHEQAAEDDDDLLMSDDESDDEEKEMVATVAAK